MALVQLLRHIPAIDRYMSRKEYLETGYLLQNKQMADTGNELSKLRSDLRSVQEVLVATEEKLKQVRNDLQTAAAARIRAEDQAREAQAKWLQAEVDANKAKDDTITSVKKIANFEALRAGAPIVPFAEVYTPMPREEAPPQETGDNPHRSPREAQMAAIARSRRAASETRRSMRDVLDEAI